MKTTHPTSRRASIWFADGADGSLRSWLFLVVLIVAVNPALGWSATARLTKATYSPATHNLSVTGRASASELVLFDADNDHRLISAKGSKGPFRLDLSNLASPPCSVRLEADGRTTKPKKVFGNPSCEKGNLPPSCKIVQPARDINIGFGEFVRFSGSARDPEKSRLRYEWDFGGGADLRPTVENPGDIQFNQRNNNTFVVSFTAVDITGRRCADRLKVTVGIPPSTPPKVPEQPAPGTPDATDGSHVVLPFTPFGMEFHDLSYQDFPQTYPINWINAVVVKKGSVGGDKPTLLNPDNNVELRYSAASNPRDPVGPDSINSTSQNYPAGATFASATIPKSDYYDPCLRNGSPYTPLGLDHAITNAACAFHDFWDVDAGLGEDQWSVVDIRPDQGQLNYDPGDFWIHYGGSVGAHEPTGVPMPGISAPYQKNEPQASFRDFDRERSVFAANGIALFPTDDRGRHNPYPIMRVQAVEKSSGRTLATGDTVVAVTTEYHCAECHSYGKVGADQKVFDQLRAEVESSTDPALAKYKERLRFIPKFLKPEDVDANRKDQRDVVERAAMLNAFILHDFTYSFARELNISEAWPTELYKRGIGTPDNCGSWCHRSGPKADPVDWGPMLPDWVTGGGTTCPEYGNALHNTHGRFMGTMNADFTGSIERDPVTKSFKLLDLSKDPKTQPAPLLHAADAGATDKSCLYCHSGTQDKYQRDVMSAAGVNCIDCHGDMAVQAGGTAMVARTNGGATNPPNSQAEKLETFHRLTWTNLPSCASCHTGDGAEPVRRRAYDMTTTEFKPLAAVDERFAENLSPKLTTGEVDGKSAILPLETGTQACPPGTFSDSLGTGKHQCERGLFKDSLDRHGALPCASCHGSPHAIWPNPDPYANDNVTAVQLQGHAGTISECSVCHTDDAFKTGAVDGLRYGTGILAGPHNMHPVNDTYWWKSTNGSSKDGGYHNSWAKKPGKKGEDQCAACHGADHRGTRLSKTATDRVLEMGKTKRFKTITVKTGTPIACDLCHSLEQSFVK